MTIDSQPYLSFQEELNFEAQSYLFQEKNRFPIEETLKIDLHCHDRNSDVPDELLGRILNIPETWLKTKKLVDTLHANQMDVITITNHNNARSCFELKSKGVDMLVGAEFSCTVPDFGIGIHVLTYGFNEEQEKQLNKLRKNLYAFLQYCKQHNLPTIWAHPLYYYSKGGIPPMDFFHKLSLVFERFEAVNGQRDTWQNMLVKFWIEGLTPEQIDQYASEYGIDATDYCHNPYRKVLTGGSDSHMGLFSGQTGSLLHVLNLSERRKTIPMSELALEAIRNGNIVPFGSHQNSEKLTIAFLDYFCQIALNMKDPGLMRILLHKGEYRDKLIALLVANGFAELRRHKVTMNFIKIFHKCFAGKKPVKLQQWMAPKAYRPIFNEAKKIARTKELPTREMVQEMNNSLNSIHGELNSILSERLTKKLGKLDVKGKVDANTINKFIEKLEIPSEFRLLMQRNGKSNATKNMVNFDFADFMDGLSFPLLASTILISANFTSTKVLYHTRPLLEMFSQQIGKLQHPKRMLWLTDTFEERNGVSTVLHQILDEIRTRNLPIDLLVCSNHLQTVDHLIVVRPVIEFNIPFYDQQSIKVPNVLEIQNLFLERSYDRIICSTEGPMGLVSLYLKHAYSVNASFYIHTDWVMFARKVLNVDSHNLNRVRRLLRAFYKAFDNLFVLNTDQQKWLTSSEMGFDVSTVHLTAHWADKIFKPMKDKREMLFHANPTDPVLLYAGRLSEEKGVMEIPEMMERIKPLFPNLKLVIAGTGPAEKELKKQLPEAIFLGWVDQSKLPEIYSSADLLLLPSKFDTFGCVVLEALSCGLPVMAYKSKGPKDILVNGQCGFLANNKSEMTALIVSYFNNRHVQQDFKRAAIERAYMYTPDVIMEEFLETIDLAS